MGWPIQKNSIDEGLECLTILSKGEPLTPEDIAAWCGCSRIRITQIEAGALKKLAARYPELREEISEYAKGNHSQIIQSDVRGMQSGLRKHRQPVRKP